MAVFGAGGVLCAMLTAFFARCTSRGRVALLTTAFLGQVALFIVLLLWESKTGSGWQIYMMAFALGSGISMTLYQLRGNPKSMALGQKINFLPKKLSTYQ